METINYAISGRSFEIKPAVLGDWITVQAFENGKPASLRYGVTIETAVDYMKIQNGESAVNALIEILKGDLANQ